MAEPNPRSPGGMGIAKAAAILFLVIGGAIAALIVFLTYFMPGVEGTTMSGHGHAAMIFGAAFTLGIGVVLMVLLFYSSRRGYDDDVAGGDRIEAPRGHREP